MAMYWKQKSRLFSVNKRLDGMYSNTDLLNRGKNNFLDYVVHAVSITALKDERVF